jgi:hypothetical protein
MLEPGDIYCRNNEFRQVVMTRSVGAETCVGYNELTLDDDGCYRPRSDKLRWDLFYGDEMAIG